VKSAIALLVKRTFWVDWAEMDHSGGVNRYPTKMPPFLEDRQRVKAGIGKSGKDGYPPFFLDQESLVRFLETTHLGTSIRVNFSAVWWLRGPQRGEFQGKKGGRSPDVFPENKFFRGVAGI
jgi:hypothetical protein